MRSCLWRVSTVTPVCEGSPQLLLSLCEGSPQLLLSVKGLHSYSCLWRISTATPVCLWRVSTATPVCEGSPRLLLSMKGLHGYFCLWRSSKKKSWHRLEGALLFLFFKRWLTCIQSCMWCTCYPHSLLPTPPHSNQEQILPPTSCNFSFNNSLINAAYCR
jgi:hypothetical protein